MKKMLITIATLTILTGFAFAETKKAGPFTVVTTDKGIEFTGAIPKGTNQVRFYRDDSSSKEMFMCGTTKTFVDYFVNPNQSYSYKVDIIVNNNWNSPRTYRFTIAFSQFGKLQ